ncbi:MAG: EF-P beta-lysylation protein EpmB [Kangiellaceae bacterium]
MENSAPIIPVSPHSCQLNSWKKHLKTAITSIDELLKYVDIDRRKIEHLVLNESDFKLRVPRSYADKMEKGNIHDPLLKQILPNVLESDFKVGFVKDPLNEQTSQVPGLLHKYHGRVLLMLASACAVNCRYCFRRHFPYSEHRFDIKAQSQVFEYLKKHTSITEVILSGGDPLMMQDHSIAELVEELEKIPHLQRLRIHTRLPVVIASRMTLELAQILAHSRFSTSLVLHINHANEIDAELHDQVKIFRTLGITLLNQSVLLKGVNDSTQVLGELSEKLFATGILPYYLHLLDPVEGTSHFDVTQSTATHLIKELTELLPGYLVPKLVKELAGGKSKTPVY